MKFLYWLESIRNPVFDWFFSVITHLGDETAFLLIAIFLFWCVNKRSGYYLMISGFFGTIINQVMKLACKVPRPWVKDPNFTIVESAREAATGYSFPSGHSQNSVSTFGALFVTGKKLWFKIVCVAICVLVPVSRMYLGVHTPWDVIAGSACAIVILILLEEFFKKDELFKKAMPIIVGLLTIGSVAFFVYSIISLGRTPDDVNVVSAAKNARTMLGCSAGLILVYVLDTFVIKFETEAKWYVQVIKYVLGIAVVFVIKTFVKIPLEALLGDNERIVRYFLIVAFAGVIWPLTFKFFARISVPALDIENIRKKLFSKENSENKPTRVKKNGKNMQAVVSATPAKYTLKTAKDYRKVKSAQKRSAEDDGAET